MVEFKASAAKSGKKSAGSNLDRFLSAGRAAKQDADSRLRVCVSGYRHNHQHGIYNIMGVYHEAKSYGDIDTSHRNIDTTTTNMGVYHEAVSVLLRS